MTLGVRDLVVGSFSGRDEATGPRDALAAPPSSTPPGRQSHLTIHAAPGSRSPLPRYVAPAARRSWWAAWQRRWFGR
ncbi:MAG: hypothetical protein U0974_03200 [Gemmatimonadales bacterium]|nr:hypothetical protein [Gemmatimonadales bacterium]MDZ4388721.1 hypothetical protein [Gemmatimonadales bacterium]